METIKADKLRFTRLLGKRFALTGCVTGIVLQASVGAYAYFRGALDFAGPILMAIPLMALIFALQSATVGLLIGLAMDRRKLSQYKTK